MYPLAALRLVVMCVMPKIIKIMPAPLMYVMIVTGVVLAFAIPVPTVGDQGELPRSLPRR